MWCLTITTPAGAYFWHIGDPEPDQRDRLIVAAKALLGFPPGDAAAKPASGWHCQLAPGDPPPALGAHARALRELEVLAADPAAADREGRSVAAWLDADHAARSGDRMAAAHAAVAHLDPQERAALLKQLMEV